MTSSSTPNSVLAMDDNSSAGRPATVIKIKPLSEALELQPVLVPSVVVSTPSVLEEKGHSTANGAQQKTEDATSPIAVVVRASDTVGVGSRSRPRLLLRARDKTRQYLPGQPRVSLDPAVLAVHGPTPNEPSLYHLPGYLRRAHLTTELDKLLPFMKYIFVQTPSHRHIMPLHHQPAHGRDRIIVDEHPGLHLVWYYERIYVKPIPAYMYSQEFWTYIHDADHDVYKACLGFLRSYYHLIQYEIDFDKACELKLIPKMPETARLPIYEEFCAFIAPFGDHTLVSDDDVSRRFQYGELRLSRINKTTMLVRRKFAYFHIYPQWGSYLSHIIAPVVTVFAFLSVIFNALQVTLAAHEVGYDSVDTTWYPFVDVAVWFPVVVMVAIAALLAAGIVGIIVMGLKDLIWAKSVRERKKQGDLTAGEKAYGVVW
ncbi:hypothetical protein MGG_01148 [Pyricularia oryzae 70-15]|uniref:Uncharacterized protein n=3 Tax=Pyricularia oryzae TaxID=318829 RepID=G4NBY9_PYRO7|nr:uncharacterized protein MGG_01148 [Pyricularia oryzae 70-15]EHA48191.1 hypothetical protein MGG_01148 [Pyricularia oryzae 70-15]KAI7917012.1 hypothetical protein M9X92_007601 [Pyricularia oryzae]KAI7926463.1 hypothetical protein M0657_003696 [Pyricularia oryzae]